MIFCSNCGKGIPAESKFCTFCGAPVPVVGKDQLHADPPSIKAVHQVQQGGQPTNLSVSKPYVAPTGKNEFYKNIGFWGAVLLVAGFFLPYASNGFLSVSFYDLLFAGGPVDGGTYLWLVFPVSGAVLILQGLTRMLPNAIVNLFKVLPLLTIILLVVVIFQNPANYGMFGDWDVFIQSAAVGMYCILAGSLLVLFFRKL